MKTTVPHPLVRAPKLSARPIPPSITRTPPLSRDIPHHSQNGTPSTLNPQPSTSVHSPPDTRHSEPLLTKEEVATFCQVSSRTVERWVERGALKCLKPGNRLRFRLSDVQEHMTNFYGHTRQETT